MKLLIIATTAALALAPAAFAASTVARFEEMAEIVREKVLRASGDEIPYVTAVVTERFEEVREDFTRINCVIVVERTSQKKIIIGKGASRLKEIGIVVEDRPEGATWRRAVE